MAAATSGISPWPGPDDADPSFLMTLADRWAEYARHIREADEKADEIGDPATVNLYDEITKLAEHALGEIIRERDDLARTLELSDEDHDIATAQLQRRIDDLADALRMIEQYATMCDASGGLPSSVRLREIARAALDRQEQPDA